MYKLIDPVFLESIEKSERVENVVGTKLCCAELNWQVGLYVSKSHGALAEATPERSTSTIRGLIGHKSTIGLLRHRCNIVLRLCHALCHSNERLLHTATLLGRCLHIVSNAQLLCQLLCPCPIHHNLTLHVALVTNENDLDVG